MIDDDKINQKELQRPKVKIITDIFTKCSDKYGFPDKNIVIREEFTKEQKQERQDYIQRIIDATKEFLSTDFPCLAKNITGGKEVAQTLMFLIKLAEACKIKSGVNTQPEQQEQPQQEPEKVEQQPEQQEQQPVQEEQKQEPQEEAPLQLTLDDAPMVDVQQQNDDKQEMQFNVEQVDVEQQKKEYEANIQSLKQNEANLIQQQEQAMAAVAQTAAKQSNFNRPPPSQSMRTRKQLQQQQETKVQIVYEQEEEQKQDEPENEVLQQLGLDNFGGDDGFTGALAQDAKDEAIKYQIPQTQQQRREQAIQKGKESQNSQIISQISTVIREIVPLQTAMSFLESDIAGMKTEFYKMQQQWSEQMQKYKENQEKLSKGKSIFNAKLNAFTADE